MDISRITLQAMNKHCEDNAELIQNILNAIETAAQNGAFILDISPALHVDTEKYFEHLGFNVQFIKHIDTTRISW